jgi:hypothetical protein
MKKQNNGLLDIDVTPSENVPNPRKKKEPLLTLPNDDIGKVVSVLYDMMKERRVLRKSSQSKTDSLLKEYNAVKRILKKADTPPNPHEVLQAAIMFYHEQPVPTALETGTEDDIKECKGGMLDSPSQMFYNFDVLVGETNKIRNAIKTTERSTRITNLLNDTNVKSFFEALLQSLGVSWEISYEEQLSLVALSFSRYLDWSDSLDYRKLPLTVQRHCDPEYMLREYYQSVKTKVTEKKQPIISKAWMNAVAKRLNGG